MNTVWFAAVLGALLVLFAALAAISTSAPGQDSGLPGALGAAVEANPIAGAEVGIAVRDVESGRVVFERNSQTLLNPASNAKLFTAAAALSLLGSEYTFDTAVFGQLVGGACAGPLVLKGYGDPSLTSADLYALAVELRAKGLRHVPNGIVLDDRYFDDERLPPAFDQNREDAWFRSAVSALSVNRNAVAIHVRPGEAAAAPLLVTADPPGFLEVDNQATGGTLNSLRISAEPYRSTTRVRVWGSYPFGGPPATYLRRIDNPTLFTGLFFRQVLRDAGIRVDGPVVPGSLAAGAPLLATHESAPLGRLLFELGKESDNFYAEMILKAIGAERAGRPGASARGAQVVVDYVQQLGLSPTSFRYVNGSGLYDADRSSADAMTRLLRAVHQEPRIRHEYIAQLAIGGVDGTLRRRLRRPGQERVVRAKTGTLDDVSALSGYVLAPPGRSAHAFAVIVNGARGRHAQARALQDAVVGAIADALWGGR